MIPQKQLTLADIFENCKKIYDSDKPQFLTLLENHIDLDEIVPISFRRHYYASTGRKRKYPLNAMLWALIIQRLFSIPTDSLLLVFLRYSRHLREFCGFTKVPDASKITRFKQDFLQDLQSVFDNLVDVTEPICQDIDSNLASMLLFDTSGIEAYVIENNPKYANRIIKQLKAYAKANNFNGSYTFSGSSFTFCLNKYYPPFPIHHNYFNSYLFVNVFYHRSNNTFFQIGHFPSPHPHQKNRHTLQGVTVHSQSLIPSKHIQYLRLHLLSKALRCKHFDLAALAQKPH